VRHLALRTERGCLMRVAQEGGGPSAGTQTARCFGHEVSCWTDESLLETFETALVSAPTRAWRSSPRPQGRSTRRTGAYRRKRSPRVRT